MEFLEPMDDFTAAEASMIALAVAFTVLIIWEIYR
jgi:hypothetical protein